MGFRVVNGNTHTEDGWPLVDRESCEWATVPGTDVSLQIQQGQPFVILRAWAADWNAYIEPLRDADSACWTETNDVLGTPGQNNGSNHLSGTACDLNWNSHPFPQRGSLNPAQMQTLSEMEDFYEDTVFWAGRWDSPVDEMHSQMGYGSFGNPHTQDFIDRKIRADGFSTFRRGGDVGPQPISEQDRIALIIIGESKRRNHTRDECIAELATGIQESQLNQDATDSTGHRGVYQQDGGYPDRETAEGNVRGFFDRLDVKRASSGASKDIWLNIFWLQQRPSEPNANAAYANGRPGYLTEIKSRIPAATDYYDRLAGVPTEEDWMANPELENMIREIHAAMYERVPSRSRYGDPSILWYRKDLPWNNDGFWYDLITEHDAALGDQVALQRIKDAETRGDQIARAFLARLAQQPISVQQATSTTPVAQPAQLPAQSQPQLSTDGSITQQLHDLRELLNKRLG